MFLGIFVVWNKMIISLLIIISWVIFSIWGDYHLKLAAKDFTWYHYLLGLWTYATCSIFTVYSFRRMDFGTMAIIWSASSLAISVISSVIVFGEPLTQRRIIAFVLVTLAVIVMGKEL